MRAANSVPFRGGKATTAADTGQRKGTRNAVESLEDKIKQAGGAVGMLSSAARPEPTLSCPAKFTTWQGRTEVPGK